MDIIRTSNLFDMLPDELIVYIIDQSDKPLAFTILDKRFYRIVHSDTVGNLFINKVNNLLGGGILCQANGPDKIPTSICLRLQKKEIVAIREFKEKVLDEKNISRDLKDYNILSLPNTLDSAMNDTKINIATLFTFIVNKGYSNYYNKILVSPSNKEISSHNLGLALQDAARNGHKEIVKYLLGCSRSNEISHVHVDGAFSEAASEGHIEIVKDFLGYSRGSEIFSYDLWRAVIYAASHGHKEVVKYLLEHPKIEISDFFSRWAIGQATEHGHEEIVQLLNSFKGNRFKFN